MIIQILAELIFFTIKLYLMSKSKTQNKPEIDLNTQQKSIFLRNYKRSQSSELSKSLLKCSLLQSPFLKRPLNLSVIANDPEKSQVKKYKSTVSYAGNTSANQHTLQNLNIKRSREIQSKSTPTIRFSRDQKIALYLSPELEKFTEAHKLRQKKPQIKYVNTLKKIRETGKKLGCSIKVKSEGVQLQLIKDKQKNEKDSFSFTFGKQFDRFFRKKLVKGFNNCRQQTANMNSVLEHHRQTMQTSIRVNEYDSCYKDYDVKRIQTYLKGKANSKGKFPFYIKKQLQQTIGKINQENKQRLESQNIDRQSIGSVRRTSPSISSQERITIGRKLSQQDQSPTFYKTKDTGSSRWIQYKQDIAEFIQICQFYKKIQHEILRYLPNNHLANKINAIIGQVQNGDIIRKIYNKCNEHMQYLTSPRIVSVLKKYQGLLSTMNYIVNIIKLNVSAQRKKRVVDTQKSVGKWQSIIKDKKLVVCNNLKTIDNQELKDNLHTSLLSAKIQCLSLNQNYVDFSKKNQNQQFSEENSVQNRTSICQILKFEALMK